MPKLGEFEMLVLLSVLRQKESPFANEVRADLETHARRSVTRGALYRTIDRLRDKRFLDWDDDGSETPERGGHPRRRLAVTPEGLEALRKAREVLLTFMDGLGLELEPR